MLPTPPAAVAPVDVPPQLITPAQTHSFEVSLIAITNKMIEQLVDKRPVSNDERRHLERAAKIKVAEILKRTAVGVSEALNSVVKP